MTLCMHVINYIYLFRFKDVGKLIIIFDILSCSVYISKKIKCFYCHKNKNDLPNCPE